MKVYLEQVLASAPNELLRLNLIREYLQARILGVLQESGAMLPLAFQGGTALRFLYAIPRYSEDLDFAWEQRSLPCNIESWLARAGRTLRAEGYAVDIKLSTQRVVNSAFLKFPGLLSEMQATADPRRVLSVNVKVDTAPPSGAVLATTLVQRHLALRLQHHDRSSLLAGKLHAVLQRPYLKGRDLYDLSWYLSQRDWPEPNFTMLNAALAHSAWSGPTLSTDNWKAVLQTRIDGQDLRQARQDVQPFLMHPHDSSLFVPEHFRALLTR